MPTYLYECLSCNKTFEVEQRITEDPLKTCECGEPVKRLIQPTAIMFKGGGFYVNDAPAASTSSEPCTGDPPSCGRCAEDGA